MADSCDFGKLLNTPCNKLLYARQTGRKKIKELDDDMQCILLWRARLLKEKDNVFKFCFHHEQFFGKVFERKTDKCCSILKSHHCNSKAQDKLASDYDFLLYVSPKKKLNLTCESIGVSPVNSLAVPPHSRASNRKGKLKKVLNVCKENTSII